MKCICKHVLSFLLAAILTICLLPVQPAQAAVAVGVQAAMNQILEDYPNGSFFTVNGKACGHAINKSCSNCSLVSICKARGKSLAYGQGEAWTCVAFSCYVMNQAFGLNNSAKFLVGKAKHASNAAKTFENAKVGDLIYFYKSNGKFGHIAICMGVTENDITLYECNASNKTGQVLYRTIPYSQMKTYHPQYAYCSVYRANNYDTVNQRVMNCAGNHTKDSFAYSDSTHPHKNYYTCSMCGEIFTDGTTTSLDSCNDCVGNEWGPWSEWSTTPVYPSNTRQVETRQIETSPARTEYRYVGYATENGKHECWCDTYLRNRFGSAVLRYSNWSTTQYTANGTAWSCGQCNGKHTGIDHYGTDGRPWWSEYTLPDGKNYYWQETRSIDAQYRTEYRYRDKKQISGGGNGSGHWEQVGWTDVAPSASDKTRNLETKTVEITPSRTEYRYVGYATADGKHECWCEAYLKSKFGSAVLRYSDWSTTQYNANGSTWSCGLCNGKHTGVDHYGSDGRAWWVEYTLPDGKNYYWKETRTTDAKYKTEYKYKKWVAD